MRAKIDGARTKTKEQEFEFAELRERASEMGIVNKNAKGEYAIVQSAYRHEQGIHKEYTARLQMLHSHLAQNELDNQTKTS